MQSAEWYEVVKTSGGEQVQRYTEPELNLQVYDELGISKTAQKVKTVGGGLRRSVDDSRVHGVNKPVWKDWRAPAPHYFGKSISLHRQPNDA